LAIKIEKNLAFVLLSGSTKEFKREERMMLMRRRLACCSREREISIDFDEHEQDIQK